MFRVILLCVLLDHHLKVNTKLCEMLSFILLFGCMLRDSTPGFVVWLVSLLVGHTIFCLLHVLACSCTSVFATTMLHTQHDVAYATQGCRIRNMMSHMQHNVAYATSECCIRNIVSRMQHIFTKKRFFSKRAR